MKLILALFLTVFSQAALPAYTYTYSNNLPTIHTNYVPIIFGDEPIIEERQSKILYSALLEEQILPNMTYEDSDFVGSVGEGFNSAVSAYFPNMYEWNSVSFNTDENAEISGWKLFSTDGSFTMTSTKGYDQASFYIDYITEVGETSNVGSWVEQQVNYQAGDNGFIFVTPVMSPVPELETYSMLMAGLVLIGFVSRKKHNGRLL